MRAGCCLSQHSNSKFHRGLWTGWQRVTAARKSFIQQQRHSNTHTHTHRDPRSCTHLERRNPLTDAHSVLTHLSFSERKLRNLCCYYFGMRTDIKPKKNSFLGYLSHESNLVSMRGTELICKSVSSLSLQHQLSALC